MLIAVLMILLFIQLKDWCGRNAVATTCSSWIITSAVLHFQLRPLLLLLVSYVFLLVYPLAATPLFPHVSLFRRKACLSVHHRDFPLVDAVVGCRCVHAIYYSHHRVSPDLLAMTSPTLAAGSLGHGVQSSRRATYELHGVAANGLTISVLLCMYMLYVTCMLKSGGIVGGGGTIKHNSI